MDSTFLGLLAGLGVKANSGTPVPPETAIELLNANARITELLETLGTLCLFKMVSREPAIPAAVELEESEIRAHPKEEMKRTCLEAHTTLMELNPANVPKFKEVAQFLAEDLKKLKTG